LSKPQYWDIHGGEGEIHMEPEAWVKIALKANIVYPNTGFFVLKTTGELGSASFQKFKAPKDSIVDFRLFGNEMNKVDWVVYKTGYPPYCNPCDTLAFGSLSLNPQKFEKLTSSVNY
jgi:hypothetical protein